MDKTRVFYEIFVPSFCDGSGGGSGDLKGVISKLDYIKDLGCDGIWLTPIMQSPSYHKYSVSDYFSIDKQFGDMDDFKRLVEECHKRDILLILDFVMNHTSTEHPWFKSAAKSLSKGKLGDPYIKYYNFSDEKLSERYYPIGDKFYMSSFSRTMPDVDLDNESVRREYERIARFWLENGADGFRMDAAKEYFGGDHEKNTAVLKWFAEYCRGIKPDCYIVAEVWEEFSDYIKYPRSGINSVFGFAMAQEDGAIARAVNSGSPAPFIKAMLRTEKALGRFPNSADAPFFCNHDTDRGADLVGNSPEKIKAAAGLLLTMAGTPYIYYGEELGMPGSGKDENKRLPMLWSSARGGTPKPPPGAVIPDTLPDDAETQLADPNSILNYYKSALKIRRGLPEIALGASEELSLKNRRDNAAAIKRTYQASSVVIVYNLGKTAANIPLSELGSNSAKLAASLTVDIGKPAELKDGVLTLPPYGIAYLK